MKCTRQQCFYLLRTTDVRFQSSHPKCSLLQGIPKHTIIALQVYNIIEIAPHSSLLTQTVVAVWKRELAIRPGLFVIAGRFRLFVIADRNDAIFITAGRIRNTFIFMNYGRQYCKSKLTFLYYFCSASTHWAQPALPHICLAVFLLSIRIQ